MTEEKLQPMFQVEITAPKRPAGQPTENFKAGTVQAVVAQFATVDMAMVSAAVSSIIDQMGEYLRPSQDGPKQCELEFGLKISGEGSVVVSKLGGEMSMRVKVTWER